MNKKTFTFVVLVALGLALGSLYNKGIFDANTLVIKADVNCDLRVAPCKAQISESKSISFSIDPKDIPLIKPLKLKVETEGLTFFKGSVKFVGINMDMGFNRVSIHRVADNTFTANGFLPVCVRDTMQWQAHVIIQTNEGDIEAIFPFETHK